MSVSNDNQYKIHSKKAGRWRNTKIWAYSLYIRLLLTISGHRLEELSAKTPITLTKKTQKTKTTAEQFEDQMYSILLVG